MTRQGLLAITLAGATLTAAAMSAPALANGGDFFEELQRHWGEESVNAGSPFFGFVRDARGKFLHGATITAKVKTTGNTRTFSTNILGHFTVAGFGKDVNPETVEVSCAKQGYKQSNIVRRWYEDRPLKPVEIQCTLSPLTAAAGKGA